MPLGKNILCALCLSAAWMMPAALNAQDTAKSAVQSDKAKPARAAKSKPAKAGKSASKATKPEPTSLEEFGKRILDAISRDQYASALAYCEQSMAAIDKNTDEDTKFRILAVCFQLYDKNGKAQEALDLSERIHPLIHDDAVAESFCFSEATLLTKLHRWDEARARYAGCAGNTDDERGIVESNIAELYMIEGDCESAVSTYRKAIALNDDNPHAFFGLASALNRLDRQDEARSAFLAGVERDPEFRFLKDAFFEPQYENDYQTGYRMYELGRWKEAVFYLDRYVSAESRPAYRETARALSDRIKASDALIVASYPILLNNVRSMTVSDSGDLIAIAVLARESAENFQTQIWSLDTTQNQARMRLALTGEAITDSAFLPGSHTLRILAPKKRYEIDLDHPENGYLIYDNPENVFELNLMPGSDDMLGVDIKGHLIISPWLNPYLMVPIVEVPLETKRLRMTADHNRMALTTTLKTLFVNIGEDRVLKDFTPLMDVSVIAVHPENNLFALGIQSGVLIVDAEGTLRGMYGSPGGGVQALAFVGGGDRLAVLTDHQLEIWNVKNVVQ